MREPIKLKPKSPKAERLINRHGATWYAINQLPSVRCLGGRSGVLLQSPNGNEQIWMVAPDTDDKNFSIVD